jgi:hypothetical protein
MTLTTGANGDSYFTLVEAQSYVDERGTPAQKTAWDALDAPAQEVRARRGSSYLDARFATRFPGIRANGATQLRAWPRLQATTVHGETIATDATPIQVKYAAIEAALREAVEPGSLSPDFVAVKRRKETVGPISEEVEYADPSMQQPLVSIIEDLLSVLLVDPQRNVTGLLV